LKPHQEHRERGPKRLRVAIVTVSTSRYALAAAGKSRSDGAGREAEEGAKGAGHRVTSRSLVSDDAKMIRREVKGFLSGDDDVLLFTGGTGISERDITVETVRPFFEKELEGFGELFRRLSYDEVGAAAFLTRATAGVAKGKLIVCMPGSPSGVRAALRAFAGEFSHAIYIARS
jgi:molybdopterin adenylyltransferase